MGASEFTQTATGNSAAEAFQSAVTQAQYDHGHAGYSGSLAEKHDFVMIADPGMGTDLMAYAEKLIDEGDPRIDDKWGPAGCIALGDNKFLFFGWASS